MELEFASVSLQQRTKREPKMNKNQQWSLQETNIQLYGSSMVNKIILITLHSLDNYCYSNIIIITAIP